MAAAHRCRYVLFTEYHMSGDSGGERCVFKDIVFHICVFV